MPYLGSESFRDWVYTLRQTDDRETTGEITRYFRPGLNEIVSSVSKLFGVDVNSILIGRRGVNSNNLPRWVAMYLCRDIGGYKLSQIASHFGLKRIGSISNTIAKLKSRMERDRKLVDKVSSLNGK